MNKAHSPINWENYPNETTPINEGNLNKMDRAIGIIDDRVIEQETKKLSKADASSDIVNVEYDKDTSVFQFTKRNGDTVKVDVSSVVVREGYTKEESDQRYANAIKSTYAGETIVSTDSSEAKFEGLRVFGRSEQASTTGKNLLKITESSATINGATFTINEDGSVTVNGTATSTCYFAYSRMDLDETERYILSGTTVKSDNNYIYIDNVSPRIADKGDGSITYVENVGRIHVNIRLDAGSYNNLVFKPMIRLASITDGTYEPYTNGPSPNPEYPQPIESVGDDGQVKHDVYDGNIVDSKKIVKNSNESVNVSDDGYTITVIGGTTKKFSNSYIDIVEFPKLKGKKLYVSIDSMSATNMNATKVDFIVSVTTGRRTYSLQDGKKEVVIPYDVKDVYVSILTNNSEDTLSSQNKVVINGIMVSLSDIPYEPYKEFQSLAISTPSGLPGIKVTDASLATYTDAEGNMWCADEIDFARGKYVQRIARINKDNLVVKRFGTSSNGTPYVDITANGSVRDGIYMSNIYRFVPINSTATSGIAVSYKNEISLFDGRFTSVSQATELLKSDGFELIYISPEPIETDLSAEEIEAYRELHSNYPTTTILNDENAHMEVTLVADTKNHIEQNYVPLDSYKALEARVLAVEQALA